MQTWKEAKLLAEGILDCKKRGVRCALLTIVSVRGSSYRKEGAKFLVTEEGGRHTYDKILGIGDRQVRNSFCRY